MRLLSPSLAAGIVTRHSRYVYELSRPWALITIVALVASLQAGVSGGALRWHLLLLSALAVACAVFGGFAFNDVLDRQLDRLAHPGRPIPTGRLNAAVVLLLASLAFAVSAATLWSLGPTARVVGMSAIVLLLAYTPLKNAYGPIGNVTVSMIVALAVVYAVLTGRSSSGMECWFVLLAASVFCALLSRELAKDVEDLEGDRGFRKTVPMILGPAATYRLSAALLTTAVLLFLAFLSLTRGYLGLFLALPVAGYGAFVTMMLLTASLVQASSLVRFLKIGFVLTLVVLVASYWLGG